MVLSVLYKILNNSLAQCLVKGVLHKGHTGFRLNKGCMDSACIHFNEIVRGRLKDNKKA